MVGDGISGVWSWLSRRSPLDGGNCEGQKKNADISAHGDHATMIKTPSYPALQASLGSMFAVLADVSAWMGDIVVLKDAVKLSLPV